MQLHNLKAPSGANKNRRRVGRGESSGWGKTAGKGMGGQKKRTGTGKPALGFEGGQMPMYRRMPKRGFVNIFAKRWAEVNLEMLGSRFDKGTEVSLESLRKVGLASNRDEGVRILGRGDLPHSLNFKVNHVTAGAAKKIESSGGQLTLIPAPIKDLRKKKA